MSHPTTPQPSIDLSGLLRGWKTVLFTTIAAMVTGAALLVSITPHQQVSAKIIVEPREFVIDGRTGTAARDKEFLPTQAEILQSPAVIEEAIQHVDKGLNAGMLTNRIVGIAENLKVDPLAGTSILLLRYSDVNAQQAADVVNALVTSYSDYLARTEKLQHHELMVALTTRDTELQTTLTGLQSEFERLKRSHADDAGADPVATARIIAALDESLATTQSRRINLERAAARISQQNQQLLTMAPADEGVRGDTGLRRANGVGNRNTVLSELAALNSNGWTGIPNPTVIEDRLRLAQSRVAALSRTLGPTHPELLAAGSEVTSSETELNRLIQTTPVILRQALESMRFQEQALQLRYDNHVRMSNINEVTRLKETQKLAEIERAQQLFDTAHAQLQQWQLVDHAMANGRAGIAVSVLEPPTPGERSFVANPMIVLGVAGLLGLMFGVFLLIALPQVRALLLQPQPATLSPTI